MEPFLRLEGVAAPLALANVDTDKILPARFLKTLSREGLDVGLFHALRFDRDGRERPDFVLNREPWRNATILIALDNFGCGSSREHAPWALGGFGIRAIIAPSFAEIFQNNCVKNGILPICFDRPTIERLLKIVGNPLTARLIIDLESQTLLDGRGMSLAFKIATEQRDSLLQGGDEIERTLRNNRAISAHEKIMSASVAWLPTIAPFEEWPSP